MNEPTVFKFDVGDRVRIIGYDEETWVFARIWNYVLDGEVIPGAHYILARDTFGGDVPTPWSEGDLELVEATP